MTRWRFLLSHVRCMAIHASAGFLVLLKLFFDRRNLRISNFLVVLMTSRARRNRHIWRQAAQRRRPRDVDVATRAFHHVPALAAFVAEFDRNALGPIRRHECFRRFVTSGTVAARRFQILPMTVETRIVRARRCLECSRGWYERISPCGRRTANRVHVRRVTHRAVVVIWFFVV